MRYDVSADAAQPMSKIGQRICGTYLPEEEARAPLLLAWVQEELRLPHHQRVLERFAASQPEPLQPELVRVDEIHLDGMVCRIPCYVTDHESPHPFRSDVVFDYNPMSGETVRR